MLLNFFEIQKFLLQENGLRRKIKTVALSIKAGPLTTINRLGEPLDLRLAGACGLFIFKI